MVWEFLEWNCLEVLCDWSDICSGHVSCEKVCVGEGPSKGMSQEVWFFFVFFLHLLTWRWSKKKKGLASGGGWNSPRVSKSPVPKCLWTFGGCSRVPTWTLEESANSTPTRPSVAVTLTNLSLCWFKPAATYIRTRGSDQSSVHVQVQLRWRVMTEGAGVSKAMAREPCRAVAVLNPDC